GLLRAAFFYLLATGDDRAVEQWQQQRRGGTRSASVTLDIIGVKAARAQLLQFGLCQLELMLSALLQALFFGLNQLLFLISQLLLLALARLVSGLGLGFYLGLCRF